MSFLEGTGFEVEMTRYDDEGLYTNLSGTIRDKKNEDLKNRVELINQSGADLVISVHLNSFPQKQYYGAHVFYQKNNEPITKPAAETIQESMKKVISDTAKKIGSDIKVAGVIRYEVGEGLEKKSENFADEVAKQMGL
jgi:N-acetylmuramoyl-L-alanine amidase